jgi:hypothetical protein
MEYTQYKKYWNDKPCCINKFNINNQIIYMALYAWPLGANSRGFLYNYKRYKYKKLYSHNDKIC